MGHAGYRPLAGGSPTARPLPGLLPARLRLSPRASDAWLAAALTLLMLATAVGFASGDSGRACSASSCIVLLAGIALAWRRRAPSRRARDRDRRGAARGRGRRLTQDAGIGIVVACYTVASVSSRRTTVVAGALAAAALGVVPARRRRRHGRGARARRPWRSPPRAPSASTSARGVPTSSSSRERAERLEREHQLLAEQIVAEERTRIARELHDVVAHHVSLMVVQGGAVRETLGSAHPLAPTLDALSGTGRQALAEMRRLLGLLRAEDDVEHAPQPGLAELAELADQVQGVRAARRDRASRRRAAPLPPGIELSAYRIVQEALTNAIRHGQAAERHRDRALASGDARALGRRRRSRARARRVTNGGHGLVGMRERVALYDGSLEAGPSPGGGYARARDPSRSSGAS